MSTRRSLTLAALLVAAPMAAGASPVPPTLKNLKPADIVEYVMAQREFLNLSDVQFIELGNLSVAIRGEKHEWIHKGGKPHRTRHVTMTSQQQAWEQAQAILSAEQQASLESVTQVPAPNTGKVPANQPKAHGGKR
jgi:hypothetical protein